MSDEQSRKAVLKVAAENETKGTFQEIKEDAASMAASVKQSGEQAAKGVNAIGDGATSAAQKFTKAESTIAASIERHIEKTKLAASAGESMARAFDQKIELRGLDASKLDPLLAKLREAEGELAKFKAQQAQSAAQSNFLDSLRTQADAIGKTNSQLLEMRATQLGMSSQAAPYIARLRETEKALSGVGMSAAATANAMRMVPAQFTDIVVSLQGGQAPLTVLLQQGGQMVDMFGSVGAAAKALAGYALGLINPFTLVAAGVAAVGVAYYQGSQEVDGYRKALVLSGNQAGTSIDQLSIMAREMSKVSGTQSAAAAALAEMAQRSKLGADQLKEYTAIAMKWEKATGEGVDKVAAKFADLGRDPLQASLKLNEEMNHLTASVYDQIKSLEKQGKTAEAAAVAQKAYADALNSRQSEIIANLGNIERAWESIKSGAKRAWDAMLGIGRTETPMAQAQKRLDDLQNELNQKLTQPLGVENDAMRASREKRIDQVKKEIEAAKGFLASMTSVDTLTASMAANNKAYVDSMEALDKVSDQFASKETKRKQALKVAENAYKNAVEETKKAFANSPELDGKLDEAKGKYQRSVAGINKQYTEKGSGGIQIGDSRIAGLQGQLEAAKQYYAQLMLLGAAASELNAGERESLKLSAEIARATDAKTIATLKQAKAIADATGVQLRTNDEMEKSLKAHQTLIDGNYKEADSIEQRAKELEAANSVYGKGRTEIERMTLAVLEHQMAEAQGSDNFDPKYIASLERKIAVQKRWVEALGQADFKQMDDQLTKSLEASRAELAIQQDGISLLGLEEVQRKKIIAQRKIALELEKEIQKIGRTTFSEDDPLGNFIQQEELKRKAKLKAETDTQTAMLQIQEDYVNQQVEQYDEIFRKGFADMLNNGKDGWKSFTKSLTTTFKTTVADQIYKMFAQPFVVKMVASLLGFTGGGGGGAAGAVSSGTNVLSAGSNVISAANNLSTAYTIGSQVISGTMSLANGLGTMYANMIGGGLDALLATNAAYGTAAASGAAAGATTGITGVLSSIPVWGWIAAAVIAAIGWIVGNDDSGTPHSGSIGSYSEKDGYRQVQNGKELGEHGIDMGMVYGGEELAKVPETVSKGIVNVLDSLDKAFGGKGGFSVTTGFADDASKDGAWGGLRIQDRNGKDLINWDEQRTRWAPREFSNGEDGLKEYLNAVAVDTRKVMMESMDLPTWAKDIVKSVKEEDFNLDSLKAVVTQIAQIQAIFDNFAKTLVGFSNISSEAMGKMAEASGGVDKLQANANTFYDNFYSQDERTKNQRDSINEQVKKLGLKELDLSAGDAREQFRKLIEEQLALGDSSAKTVAALLALSGAVAQVTTTAEQAAEAKKAEAEAQRNAALSAAGLSVDNMVNGFLAEVNDGRGAKAGEWLADTISAGFERAIYGQALSVIMNSIIDGVITPVITAAMAGSSISSVVSSAAIDTMVKNATAAADALAQLLNDPAFKKAMEEIIGSVRNLGNTIGATIPKMASSAGASAVKAAEAAKKAQDDAFNYAMRTLEQSTARQVKALGDQKAALAEQKALADESLNLITGIFELVHDSARDLYGEVDATRAMQAQQARSFITQAASAAQLTGYLPDQDQLGEAINAARDGISDAMYKSQAERDYDTLVLAGELAKLESVSGKQKTAAEKQVDLLDDQIKSIDKQTEFLQEQLAHVKDLVSIGKNEYDATMSVDDAMRKVLSLLPTLGQSPGSGGGVGGGSPIESGGGPSGPATPPKEYKREVVTPTGSYWEKVTGSEADYLAKVDKWLDRWRDTGDVKGMLIDGKYRGFRMIDISSVMGWSYRDLVNAGKNVGIPQFAVGTNYVPEDMTARIHKGERIIPAADNRALIAALDRNGGSATGGEARLIAAMQRLEERLAEIENNTAKGAEFTRRAARDLDQVTDGGNAMRMVPV